MTTLSSRTRALLPCGLLVAGILLGSGVANAAPEADEPVPARCGQTVRAAPSQEVRVTPALGVPFLVPVEAGMDPIRRSVAGVLCRVDVDVIEPVAATAPEAAPPLRSVTKAAQQAAAAVDPEPRRPETPAQASGPTPAAAAPRFTPQQAAAAAPRFGPAFGALPSSFLRSATGPAPGLRADVSSLLGSAFPGLRAGAPAYLGYDPASAVTTASQVQALPIDGLAEGGVGIPALLAVLGISGVAAFLVRRLVFSRTRPTPATSKDPRVERVEDVEHEDVDDGPTEFGDTTEPSKQSVLVTA